MIRTRSQETEVRRQKSESRIQEPEEVKEKIEENEYRTTNIECRRRFLAALEMTRPVFDIRAAVMRKSA